MASTGSVDGDRDADADGRTKIEWMDVDGSSRIKRGGFTTEECPINSTALALENEDRHDRKGT